MEGETDSPQTEQHIRSLEGGCLMIAIWNRREVFVTLDMKRFNQVRDFLENQGIAYSYRTKSMGGSAGPWTANTRARMGSIGERQACSVEYHIFVHKKEYEKVMFLLRKVK